MELLEYYKKKCRTLEKENLRLKKVIHKGVKSLLEYDVPTSPLQESRSPLHPPKVSSAATSKAATGAQVETTAKATPPAKRATAKPTSQTGTRVATPKAVTPKASSSSATPVSTPKTRQVSRALFGGAAKPMSKTLTRQSSYDRIPTNTAGPSYAHKGKPVRGKKRKMLPGQVCDNCEGYYEAAGIPGAQGKCSKHRAEQPRPRTPPGFWGLDFPTTPELRARQSALPSPEDY